MQEPRRTDQLRTAIRRSPHQTICTIVPVTVEVLDAARDPRGSVSNAACAADGGRIGMLAWFAVTPPGACVYTTLPFGTPRAKDHCCEEEISASENLRW